MRPASPVDRPRVRLLLLVAAPNDAGRLKPAHEVRRIREELRAAEHRDSIDLIERWGVRPDDLQHLLLEARPHIVHFCGHGTTGEELVFEGSDGEPAAMGKGVLADVFRALGGDVRAVVLSACHSRSIAEAIAEHVDCALGMRRAVGSEAAAEFSAAFYRAIGFGRSVLEAFESGVIELKARKIPEAGAPQLVLRAGVDAHQVILIPPVERAVVEAPPSQGTTEGHAPTPLPAAPSRSRARVKWALPLAAITVIAVAVVAATLESRSAIPPFVAGKGGLVIAGSWPSVSQEFESLCEETRNLDRQGVRCVALPPWKGRDGIIATAGEAGASWVAVVGVDAAVQLTPLGRIEGDGLLRGGVPPIDIARRDDRARLAPLLLALAQSAAPDYDYQPLPVRCPPVHMDVPDRIELLTLFAGLRVPRCAPDRIEPEKVDAVCGRDSGWSCAVARYFHAERCPACDTDRDVHALEWLRDQAPEGFRVPATLKLGRLRCERGERDAARQAYDALAASADACIRLAVTEIGDCLSLSPSGGAPDWPARADEVFASGEAACAAPKARARYLGRHAWWLGRRGMWVDAGRYYRRAWDAFADPLYFLSAIEAELHLREAQSAYARLKANESARPADPQGKLYYALLRWIAARQAGSADDAALEARRLVAAYDEVPTGQVALEEDADLRALACPEPERACALDVITREKGSESSGELARRLGTSPR